MSNSDISNNLLTLIEQKMRGNNISLEAFNRVVEEELARITTKAVHESRGSAFRRFVSKHSGALVSFVLGTVLATLLTVAIDKISEGKQEQRKFEEDFEQRVNAYERIFAERTERGNLLRFAIRYEMPAADLAYRKEKYDESYLQSILSFSQFRRFTTQALAKKKDTSHLIVKADTADESDVFSALIEGYLLPLSAAMDGCLSYTYRIRAAAKDGNSDALIGDLLDHCPYGVSRPAAWTDWSEEERAKYQKMRAVEYYSASDLNTRSRECLAKIFDSVKDVVVYKRPWDLERKQAVVNFCSMRKEEARVLSCGSDVEQASAECSSSKNGLKVVKNDLRRTLFLQEDILLGRMLAPPK